jgi:hypothetical protein
VISIAFFSLSFFLSFALACFLLMLLGFLIVACVAGQPPVCMASDCTGVMANLLKRLPGNCNISFASCQAELVFQITSTIPIDGETLFGARWESLFSVYRACAVQTNNSAPGYCSKYDEIQRLRVTAARTPGDFGFVWSQAFNFSLRPPEYRGAYIRRVPFCILRERAHIVACLEMCSNSVFCVSTFQSRLDQLDIYLRLIRGEIVGLRFVPFVLFCFVLFLFILFCVCVCFVFVKNRRQTAIYQCGTGVLSRPCLNSSVPFEMCDLELWFKWLSVIVATQL